MTTAAYSTPDGSPRLGGAAAQIEPGVYEIRGNGRVDVPARTEIPAMPTFWAMDGGTPETWLASPGGQERSVPALHTFVNTGSADCTVTIVPAVDIPVCPCMVHGNPGRQGAHAARTMIAQQTVFAGWQDGSGDRVYRRTMLKIETLPPGYPMIVYVEGYQPGVPAVPPVVPENTLPPYSSPYGFDTGQPLPGEARAIPQRPIAAAPALAPTHYRSESEGSEGQGVVLGGVPRTGQPVATALAPGAMQERLAAMVSGQIDRRDPVSGRPIPPVDSVARIEAEQAHDHAQFEAERLVASTRPDALIPGFILVCGECHGLHISQDQRNGHVYHECEDCGNIRRLVVKDGGPLVPGFGVVCAECRGSGVVQEIREKGPVWECSTCGNVRRVRLV